MPGQNPLAPLPVDPLRNSESAPALHIGRVPGGKFRGWYGPRLRAARRDRLRCSPPGNRLAAHRVAAAQVSARRDRTLPRLAVQLPSDETRNVQLLSLRTGPAGLTCRCAMSLGMSAWNRIEKKHRKAKVTRSQNPFIDTPDDQKANKLELILRHLRALSSEMARAVRMHHINTLGRFVSAVARGSASSFYKLVERDGRFAWLR